MVDSTDTEPQMFPSSIRAIFLSLEREIPLRLANKIVMPPSTKEAPAKAAWPPLLAANGHCDNRARSKTTEIWVDLVGLKMQ